MRLFLLVLGLLFFFRSEAQTFTTDSYYLFPINPGQQNFLAGTMGELRSSHFHAGLDIKTGGKEGLPIHAAADGYVSRIKISTGGYGLAIYLNHPNGTTTVYAHCDRFQEEVAKYVVEKQYEEESYEVDLFPKNDEFVFKQGEIIAYSGNTGSSSGPHLHFEIRDLNQRILDPLRFGFKEVHDDIAPVMQGLAFVTLDGKARVNDTYGRFEFDLIKNSGVYTTTTPISLKGKIGIEFYGYDLLNGVYNRNGIPKATLVIDKDTVFSHLKSSLSFGHQRNILVHMDYDAYRASGAKYSKLFVDEGNTSDFYTKSSDGYHFDDSVHSIQIHLEDSYGNITTFQTEVNTRNILNKPDPKIDKFEVYRNHLHFKTEYKTDPHPLKLYFGGIANPLTSYRADNRKAYYLWDLRDGLPDSVDYCGEMLQTEILAMIPSHTDVRYYHKDADLRFKESSLFDTLYLRFQKDVTANSELFQFLHPNVPIRNSVTINLKPQVKYLQEKSHVYAVSGNSMSFMGGSWQKDGTVTFTTRDLVTFTIAADTILPVIKPVIINSKEIFFKIDDERAGIKSYRATLNGQFLLMNYEYKKKLIWAVPKEKNKPLKGELVLEVEDNAGNKSIYQKTL